MNIAVARPAAALEVGAPAARNSALDRARLEADVAAACARIAPLWPLRQFVAVNPFLGVADRSFAQACAEFRRLAGARLLMPRSFYRQAVRDGRITEADLSQALAQSSHAAKPAGVAALRQALEVHADSPADGAHVATVAEVLDTLAAGDRQASRTAFMIDEISRWCAAYFDEGQAIWRAPARDLPLYAAWRAAMRFDRNAEVMGVAGFRAAVAELPADPVDAIAHVLEALDVPPHAVAEYLHRALFDIGGWAAYARYLGWRAELAGETDDSLLQLLAVRVVWGYGLFRSRRDAAFVAAWRAAMQRAWRLDDAGGGANDRELAVDLVAHEAYEAACRRELFTRLRPRPGAAARPAARPSVQAAFCIDVRSEVYRRALERLDPDIETMGFAGFFGLPIEYAPLGRDAGDAHCPVLLAPTALICEVVEADDAAETARAERGVRTRRRVARAWRSFKASAVSSFAFVEAAGLGFGVKLAHEALGRPDALTPPLRLAPQIAPGERAGRESGLALAKRVDLAEGVLRAMQLTEGLARIVLLVGHGATSRNNPHAAGLDCGACGGHSGEANARVAAALLNDPVVRSGLAERGVRIPEDTWFAAGLHDTTTDSVRIFDWEAAPAGHRTELTTLQAKLAQAAVEGRRERAAKLGIDPGATLDREVLRRSRDWSQVRPEWGLAGCAAFLAAPRALTREADLGGRVFLQSYDWRRDAGFATLELVLTAPLVVASWINLQYFASTANNAVFGAGDKTLHNVVGGLGVLEGNGGDLRTGLPLQSVHDGRAPAHEPVRLNALIAAPTEAMNRVIALHEGLQRLLDNRWIHLFALSDAGEVTRRYVGGQTWERL